MQVKTNDGRDAHSASGIGRIRSPGIEQGGIMLSPEAMTEPSSDGLKENKKESQSKFLSFFPIRDRRRRFPSFRISVAIALIVKPLITELSHIRK